MKNIAFLLGSFKPPHIGHFDCINQILNKKYINHIYIIIGNGIRDNINQNDSYNIWDIYIKNYSNITLIKCSKPPINEILEYINQQDSYYFFYSEKESYKEKYKYLINKFIPNLHFMSLKNNYSTSGTKMREFLKNKDLNNINDNLPNHLSFTDKSHIIDILLKK